MKTASKVFIILSMIFRGFFFIIPGIISIIVGIFALKRIDTAKKESDLTGMAVLTLLFSSFIGGILMLFIKCNQNKQETDTNSEVINEIEKIIVDNHKEPSTKTIVKVIFKVLAIIAISIIVIASILGFIIYKTVFEKKVTFYDENEIVETIKVCQFTKISQKKLNKLEKKLIKEGYEFSFYNNDYEIILSEERIFTNVKLEVIYIDLPEEETLSFKLNLDEQSYSVIGIGKCKKKNITIPEVYSNLSVTSIGYSAFSGCRTLESITIPSSVTTIGNDAFNNCTSLKSITIPSSVTSIGNGAFYNCTSLESITIPSSVTSIGEGAFSWCTSLENVYYNGTIEDWCNISFGNSDSNPMYYAKHFHMLDSNNKYQEVTEIVIPDTITEIGAYQFYEFDDLNKIYIPSSVTSIGEGAFYGCTSLENVYYNGTIEEWCNISFSNAYSNPMKYASHFYMKDGNGEYKEVTEIEIPDIITTLGNYQFLGFNNITKIKIPSSVTRIGSSAFDNCTSLKSITIPSSVISIGSYVFAGCRSLTIYCETSIEPSGWDEYWNNSNCPVVWDSIEVNGIAFDYDNNILKITKYIGNDKFLEIPSSVLHNNEKYNLTSIESYAFSGCISLNSITIPSSITSIGAYAFLYCTSLKNVYYNGTIEDWCNISFGNSDSNPMYYAKHFYMLDNEGNYKEVTEIEIPNTITSISDYSFYNFNKIKSIVIPSSVTSIAESAFCGCTSLENVYYNGTIEEWCNISFSNAYSNPMKYASHFYMKDGNGEYKEVTEIEIPDTITSIGRYQFYGFSNITSITIPSSVISIGSGAFAVCRSLTSIEIPSSVTSIGSSAFGSCESLEEVIFENDSQLTSIGSSAFYNCSSLERITIPSSVTSIEEFAFSHCRSLKSIIIPFGVTSIGSGAFYGCKSLTIYCETSIEPSGWDEYWNNSNCPVVWDSIEVNGIAFDYDNNILKITKYIGNDKFLEIPSSVLHNNEKYNLTSIESYAFSGCISLNSITIPSTITNIGSYAFENCTSLENVYYNGTIEDWCNISFGNKYSNPMYYAKHFYMLDNEGNYKEVTEIEIPNTITSISDYSFYNFNKIKSIVIPTSVTSIGESAFSECINLKSITIPSSVTSIGSYAFYNCTSLKNVYYNGTIEDWCNISFEYSSNPMSYATHFYMLDSNNEYQEVTEIEIPDTITSIGRYQFYGFNNLTKITIPSSVTSIGKFAFENCRSLTSIEIPSSVTSIREGAFSWCTSLENVYYNGTIEDWCNISFEYSSNPMSYATHFYMLDSNNEYQEVTEIEIPDTITSIGRYQFYGFNNLTKITIPSSVTSIGKFAFENCRSLTSIEIPSSVTSIREGAFSWCTSLENVYYNGTIEDWCNISFEYSSNPMSYAIHFYMLDSNNEYQEVTEIEIPDTITSIVRYQFYGFNNLTKITIPSSVTSIEEFAFSHCRSLTSIEIPSSVTSIGYRVFSCCTNLRIYCEAASKPNGWSDYWNEDNCPVIWGYSK